MIGHIKQPIKSDFSKPNKCCSSLSKKTKISYFKPKKAYFIDKKKKGFYYENHNSKKQTIDFISFSIHTIFIHIFNFLVIHGKTTYRHYIMLPHEKYAVNLFFHLSSGNFHIDYFVLLAFIIW